MHSAEQRWSFYADGKRPASGNGRLCSSFEDLTEDEVVEEGWQHQAEKKRRLSSEQVKFLEHSFEMENRLEPDRKLLIAKHLSLQPRQVAVWFQNRRARWKTRQLEQNFDVLKASYDAISMENQKLQAEVASLNALLNGSNVTKPESSVQDKTTSAPPAIDIYPKSNEKIVENAEGILFKSEVDSPTKSDQSEVSDCNCYIHESEASALRMIEDSDSAFCSNVLLESVHNPVLHYQDAAIKQEGDLFQEENCALIFNWEEHGFFSWYG